MGRGKTIGLIGMGRTARGVVAQLAGWDVHIQAEFNACYTPVSAPFETEPGTVDHWLTERYCLYATSSKGRLYRCEVHPLPWPLQRAEADIDINTVCEANMVSSCTALLHDFILHSVWMSLCGQPNPLISMDAMVHATSSRP